MNKYLLNLCLVLVTAVIVYTVATLPATLSLTMRKQASAAVREAVDAVVDEIKSLPRREAVEFLAEVLRKAAEEEETRLFYVGVTRAKNELELVTASRGYCGALTPSPFIRALTARMDGKRVPARRE